jgi:AraC family transcriptional regulator, regulatory protein of adaptative response / methylated-DNA-[protein]-cysteine methyltransferase
MPRVLDNSFSTEAARWRAVVQRRKSADSRFFFGVKTTRIFCRPWCPSRRPLRKNVVFFDAARLALGAGFRPCLRCRPMGEDPRQRSVDILVKACRLLESDDSSPKSADVAAQVGLSPHYFQRFFKRQTGVTPQQYRNRRLSDHVKRHLAESKTVTQAAHAAGYASTGRFYARAGKELGMSARMAKDRADGQLVRYAVCGCSLGKLLVAWTDRGVCDVRLGDSSDELVDGLRDRLRRATIERAPACPWVACVLDAVEQPARQSSAEQVPLDIRGTAFQERIWQELRKIPPGQTRTYSELAAACGAPRAVRAVARACATNPVAVVVPCHRVIRGNGELAGYRWGVGRKQELLRREESLRDAPPQNGQSRGRNLDSRERKAHDGARTNSKKGLK